MNSQRGVDKETSPDLDTNEESPDKRFEVVPTVIMQPDMVSKTVYAAKSPNLKGNVLKGWQ